MNDTNEPFYQHGKNHANFVQAEIKFCNNAIIINNLSKRKSSNFNKNINNKSIHQNNISQVCVSIENNQEQHGLDFKHNNNINLQNINTTTKKTISLSSNMPDKISTSTQGNFAAINSFLDNKQPKKKKRIGPKVFRVILLVVLSFFIGIGIFNINARCFLRDPYPTIGGFGSCVVLSGSMEPALSVNDLIIFQEQDKYYPGDIAVYVEQDMGLVAHRIISIDNDNNVLTKGDANNTTDKKFDIKNIKGKIVFVVPQAGIIFNDYTKIGLLLILILLLIWSFINEGKTRRKETKRLQLLKDEIDKLKAMQ